MAPSTESPSNVITARALARALKGYSHVSLHAIADPRRESWSDAVTVEVTASHGYAGRSEPDTRTTIAMDGTVHGGHSDSVHEYEYEGGSRVRYDGAHRPSEGYWTLMYGAPTLRALVDLLPPDAALTWDVYLDAGTHEAATRVRFHVDHLYLLARYKVRGKDVETKFLVDVSCGPHNSARFGVRP